MRARWNVKLGDAVLCEFDCLPKAGLKFNTNILQTFAHQLIAEAPTDTSFHRTVKSNGEYVTKRITTRWAQHFIENHNIVVKRVGGKLRPSDDKLARIEKEVAFHLGQMERGFESRMENADETHFVCNMQNGKTLGFKGEDVVSYADVVSGGQSMTMMVRLTGDKNALIKPPMHVFQNAESVRSIRNVPDTVPGVFYRTSRKGWIDRDVWNEWLQHEKSISSRFDGKTTHLLVDNCSSHIEDEDAIKHLQTKNTVLHKLPSNVTHLVQPADSFVIQKLKDAWRRHWDGYSLKAIEEGKWNDKKNPRGSGNIINPGKRFFLKLAANCVRDVNRQRTSEGITYARKAMIRCGMSLNLNGNWEEDQVSNELQEIVAKYRNHFDGEPVHECDVATESDSEMK